MKYDKSALRKIFLLKRKNKYSKIKKINFNVIFKLIKKIFKNKKVVIAGYYPSNYEVNILDFLKKASEKRFKIALPIIHPSNKMSFNSWIFKEPLNISKFGTLEPQKTNKEIIPDLIMVPLVAFDKKLNRIGYGKGYYDRSLQVIKKKRKKTISLGIAYSFQKCIGIPINKYDYRLDYILTEYGIIKSNY